MLPLETVSRFGLLFQLPLLGLFENLSPCYNRAILRARAYSCLQEKSEKGGRRRASSDLIAFPLPVPKRYTYGDDDP